MLSNPLTEEKTDPRVKRTRAMLQQAFTEVLAEKGFQNISVLDITEKAGVNRTTFYLHFPDKFALLDFSIGQSFRQELEKRTLNLCHYSAANLQSLIITVAEFIQFSNSHCKSNDPQFEMLVERQVKKKVQDLLQVWLDMLEVRPSPNPAAVAGSWAIYGLALDWNHTRNHPAVESFAESVSPPIRSVLGLTDPVGEFEKSR
jgi:AcrR family transcriptional regulator